MTVLFSEVAHENIFSILEWMWFKKSLFPAIQSNYAKKSVEGSEAQKQMSFNSLIIHYLIMTTFISYDKVFTISLPKCINIVKFYFKHV